MKNLLKFGLLAAVISMSVAACNTNRNRDTGSDTSTTGGTSMDTTTTPGDTTMATDSTDTARKDSIR